MKGTQSHKDHSDKDRVAELFQHASARERPPAADELAIRKALHAEWSGMTKQRRRRKALFTLAAAASVVLAVMVGVNLTRSPQPLEPVTQVAVVEKQRGSIRVLPGVSGNTQNQGESSALMSGQQLVTGKNSGLALRWFNGESIRLDESTELRLSSASEIHLLAGQIYLDTDEADTVGQLQITTPAGLVRHIGTRYMTAVSGGVTSVSVREGQVLLDMEGMETLAERGDQLKVDPAGTLARQTIPTYGDLWQWTEELAPAFSSDGRSMVDFLDWVGHESGRLVEFASPAAQKLAGETLLRGKVDMDPMQALTVVLQTSDLMSETSAGTIVVRLRSGG